jgi:hypothetical protein
MYSRGAFRARGIVSEGMERRPAHHLFHEARKRARRAFRRSIAAF